MTEPADLKSADTISLAMGRSDERFPIGNGTMANDGSEVAGRKCGDIKHFLHLFLPHFGLFLATIAYITLVAFAIQYVEGPTELQEQTQLRAELERLRTEFIVHFRNKPIILGGELEAESKAFTERVLSLGWHRGRLGVPLPSANVSSSPSAWTLPNSFLFATSLVAGIGYGHLVPITCVGKILTQLFALFGIPIFLVHVADIGRFGSSFLHWAYKKVAMAWKKRKGHSSERNNNGIGSARYGDRSEEAEDDDDKLNEIDYSLLGSFSLLPLLGCCALTAFVFWHLEEWHFLDCFYFAFTSFSSIGFGDFAPSTSLSALVTICALFVCMPFAILFVDLVGTIYVKRIHWIGRKLGNWLGGYWDWDQQQQRRDEKRRNNRRKQTKRGG